MACHSTAEDHAEVFRQTYLEHAGRTALFVDAVESVRLIEADQAFVIGRWLNLVNAIHAHLETFGDGRIAKHTGDGLLLEFESARKAVEFAFSVLEINEAQNIGVSQEQRIMLRFGASLGKIIQSKYDLYGHEVNVAARLLDLARPGELLVSATVRDHLTADIDAEIEDIGECYLRHVSEPVRAFRVRPVGVRPPALITRYAYERLIPAIAILPLESRSSDPSDRLVGEALCDELTHALSRTGTFDVISRLSSRAVAGRGMASDKIAEVLGVDYLLSGSFTSDGSSFQINLELCESRSGRIIWSPEFVLTHAELAEDRAGYVEEVVKGAILAITRAEVQLVRKRPLPTLRAYTLLTAAVNLMQRLSRSDFERARDVLDALLDRAPREPLALARKAEWWVLRAQQGWSEDLERESHQAADAAARAVDEDPDCSVALMADGAVQVHFFKRLDVAESRYDEAISADQSNSMAWLRRGTLCAFTDRGERAVGESLRARSLSPIDPTGFLMDSLTASAYLTAGDDTSALAYAERSLVLNRLHTSTLRVKAVAQWRLGKEMEARKTVEELLHLEPNLTIGGYLRRVPSAQYQIGCTVAEVLHKAGVPN